jgi:hypothetical protein
MGTLLAAGLRAAEGVVRRAELVRADRFELVRFTTVLEACGAAGTMTRSPERGSDSAAFALVMADTVEPKRFAIPARVSPSAAR